MNKYSVEQKKLEKDQSKFEAPAILRNAEIEYEKARIVGGCEGCFSA